MPLSQSNIDWYASLGVGLLGFSAVSIVWGALVASPAPGEHYGIRRAHAEAVVRRWGRKWLLGTVGLSAAGVAVFLAGTIDHDAAGAYGATTAAWVQAFGSIAAVIGAAAVAGWQSNEARVTARREDRAARVDRVMAMGAVAIHLAQRLNVVEPELMSGPTNMAVRLRALHRELDISARRISGLFDISLGSSVVQPWIAAEARLAALQVTLEIAGDAWARNEGTAAMKAELGTEIGATRSSMIAVATACHGPMLQTAIGTEPA